MKSSKNMTRKKIDSRLRTLIENGIIQNYRSVFVIVGNKARDQVPIFHHMLIKSQFKPRVNVLWCYKKELGFSTNRKKRIRTLNMISKMTNSFDEDDPFEVFISNNTIRWCYYHETHRILGNTYDMLVLQDFEALTPNLLARTIETVMGGGIIIFLLNTLDSIKQLYTMTMDVHARYRTVASADIICRFNERFILSLSSCLMSLVVDDRLNVLPISSHYNMIETIQNKKEILSESQIKLNDLKNSLVDNQPLGSLINICKTYGQAQAVIKFIKSLVARTSRTIVSLTSARGRGKSAALGLAIAGAIAYNYCNIFVTSPSPENLRTLFEFIQKGLEAIHLKLNLDYELVVSDVPDHNKTITKITVFRHYRQVIQYISPSQARDENLLSETTELLVIDEAAAIPLTIVQSLFGPYTIFLSSTVNGYEGTGRSLSLKLLKQLREQTKTEYEKNSLTEISLEESIRYKDGDLVEKWLNQLLCLDVNDCNLGSIEPKLEDCKLYYIDRDVLFSYHKKSEEFLQRLMALYVSSHYKNTPNDIQMMSDAPAHQLFCLLGPENKIKINKSDKITMFPKILCFIQVCLEGSISSEYIMNSLDKGKRASGDLIPWIISQQFQDESFGRLSGARIVRIATNPNLVGKGYGTKAIKLLEDYYTGKIGLENQKNNLIENPESQHKNEPENKKKPLLLEISKRSKVSLDWIGVSYGLNYELFRFWEKNGYIPTYLRQTCNDLTGEYSIIMLKNLQENNDWLKEYANDFLTRFVRLLNSVFNKLPLELSLKIINCIKSKLNHDIESNIKPNLQYLLKKDDLKRILDFIEGKSTWQNIIDLPSIIGSWYFTKEKNKLSYADEILLLGLGCQRKTIHVIKNECRIEINEKKFMEKLKYMLEGI